jgi:cation:H+ antiporter
MSGSLLPLVGVVVGLVVLVVGGELLVRGASALALAARVSPLVVGLTVVAYGTSSPELAVSVRASFAGQADIAVGNVVGSNICNILLILGASALICPLVVHSQLIRFDVPVMILVSIVLMVMGWNHSISRGEGLLLFAGALAYTVWAVVQSRRESRTVQAEFAEHLPARAPVNLRHVGFQVLLIVVGLLLLAAGANWLVDGAVEIARTLGVSELIIGLTIVAVGTSLPEMVTSIVAAVRGARDIAVGNIVGSNIFNILAVLGLSSVLAPNGVRVSDAARQFDIPVMVVVAIACLPVFVTGNRIARWEGLFFLAYYVAYTSFLVFDALEIPQTRSVAAGIMAFVLPITVVTLTVSLVRQFKPRNADLAS